MARGFLISDGLRDRIYDTIERVSGEPYGGKVTKVAPLLEGGPRGAQPQKTFRICTFTGSWSIGSSKTVTFKNVTNTPNTASASNLFWPIPDGPQRDCSIAKDGTAWYLLVPQLYAANAATAATITTAALEFNTLPVVALATSSTAAFSVSISTCATATAS